MSTEGGFRTQCAPSDYEIPLFASTFFFFLVFLEVLILGAITPSTGTSEERICEMTLRSGRSGCTETEAEGV